LRAALLVDELSGMATDSDGGDGAPDEAFIDVIGVVGTAIPVAQAVMFFVGTRTIRAVTGPLDQLMALMEGRTPAG
jgi:hypothetical protein